MEVYLNDEWFPKDLPILVGNRPIVRNPNILCLKVVVTLVNNVTMPTKELIYDTYSKETYI